MDRRSFIMHMAASTLLLFQAKTDLGSEPVVDEMEEQVASQDQEFYNTLEALTFRYGIHNPVSPGMYFSFSV